MEIENITESRTFNLECGKCCPGTVSEATFKEAKLLIGQGWARAYVGEDTPPPEAEPAPVTPEPELTPAEKGQRTKLAKKRAAAHAAEDKASNSGVDGFM
jgi:hypothetical protein